MNQIALLIIDMQNDFCLPGAPLEINSAQQVMPNIKAALEACRRFKIPVIHVFRNYSIDGSDVEITNYKHFKKSGGIVCPGTKGAQIVDELSPLEGEYLIIKRRWSAFFQTELDCLLKRLGVGQIVVTGVQTPNCIRATVWDANSLDYEVIVLSDGTGAKKPEVHEANLYDMQNIGIKLLSAKEFIMSLPNPPKEDLVGLIRSELSKEQRSDIND